MRTPIVSPRILAFVSKLFGMKYRGYFFFPWIFIDRPKPEETDLDYPNWMKTVRHESIHYKQAVEALVIGFLIIYYGHYLINLIKYKDSVKAYKSVIFEKEAYKHQWEEDYLNKRKIWACFK